MYRRIQIKHRFVAAILILILVLATQFGTATVRAASATVGFEAGQDVIYLQDQVEISLTIQADTTLGDFEGNITYDSSVFEYVSGPDCIAGGDGMLRVSDIGAAASVNQRSYVMTFQAIGYGTSEFNVIGSPVAYTYEDNTPMSVFCTSFETEVVAPETACENADLSSLKISPGTLSPEFSPAVTLYSAEVASDVTRLVMSAVPQDENATVKVSGNQDFTEGSNQVLVTVTAESGAKKVYTIQVQQNAASNLTPTPVVEQDITEWSFTAQKVNGLTLLKGTSTYTVINDETGITIPDGYSKTSIKVNGITVSVYQLEAVKDDDFLLMILQNSFGQTNLYKYDKVEKTIQRYTGDRVLIKETTDSAASQLASQKAGYEKRQQVLVIFVAILGLCCLGLLIGLVTTYLKLRNKGEDEFY